MNKSLTNVLIKISSDLLNKQNI